MALSQVLLSRTREGVRHVPFRAWWEVPPRKRLVVVVTNRGAIAHEFVVGDEATQVDHETEMQAAGSMTMDEPSAIGLAPGETKELTLTFSEPGETLAGCHVPGHYPAGMRATIIVAL